jgi:hypothetical protein
MGLYPSLLLESEGDKSAIRLNSYHTRRKTRTEKVDKAKRKQYWMSKLLS